MERFGASVVDSDLEKETARGRRRALAMYEEIRGFPLDADLDLIEERIRAYAIPPDSSLVKVRLAAKDWIRRFWGRVN